MQRQVFERFYRLDGSIASGSGLGLAIARELAELMGGSVELETDSAADDASRSSSRQPCLRLDISTGKRAGPETAATVTRCGPAHSLP